MTPSLSEMELLSLKRLAGLLELSDRQTRRLHLAGKLPEPLRIGRAVRWRAIEVKAWMDAGCPSQHEWIHIKQAQENGRR